MHLNVFFWLPAYMIDNRVMYLCSSWLILNKFDPVVQIVRIQRVVCHVQEIFLIVLWMLLSYWICLSGLWLAILVIFGQKCVCWGGEGFPLPPAAPLGTRAKPDDCGKDCNNLGNYRLNAHRLNDFCCLVWSFRKAFLILEVKVESKFYLVLQKLQHSNTVTRHGWWM